MPHLTWHGPRRRDVDIERLKNESGQREKIGSNNLPPGRGALLSRTSAPSLLSSTVSSDNLSADSPRCDRAPSKTIRKRSGNNKTLRNLIHRTRGPRTRDASLEVHEEDVNGHGSRSVPPPCVLLPNGNSLPSYTAAARSGFSAGKFQTLPLIPCVDGEKRSGLPTIKNYDAVNLINLSRALVHA